ncbi:sigma 54-interacting transcriptional regulator [Arcobacteraceae bacterium]|nr:sigma 54-interacting transcriptional regulator [Arcobacteraceae bacterium]
MKKFIAKSDESKKILNIVQVSSSLPINVLIRGESGVGKKLLAKEILPNAISMDGKFLENVIINNSLNIDQYKELIITDIHQVLNKKEFLSNLTNIKIVATSKTLIQDIEEQFAIKVDISPLVDRKEDLDEISSLYVANANEIYKSNVSLDSLNIDISENGISLKNSIYKNTLLHSMNEEDITKALEHFISKKLDEQNTYKYFLKLIEVPLINMAKFKFKSQLQMATKLNLNRITLRKKIEQYFGNDND